MPENKEKILSIQFLRGIGAIMVVLCHTSFTNWGTSGVEFFLIISGFVAMYSTRNNVKNYWIKRIVKIVPLYWFMTIVTGFFVYIAPQLFNSYEVNTEYLVKSLLFIPYEHSGILAPLMGLGWTLNYEMFFYLLFWVAIKINYKRRGEYCIVISLILVVLGKIFDVSVPFSFWVDDILLEFSYGIILFLLYEKYSNEVVVKDKKAAHMLLWTSVLIGTIFMEKMMITDISRAIGVGIIGFFIIGIVLICGKTIELPKGLIYVGNISYVLYLTHIYPVRLMEAIIKCSENLRFLLTVISIMFAIICAAIWDFFVEQRIQKVLQKCLIYKNIDTLRSGEKNARN